jgi:maleylacetate reductase
MGLTFQHTTLGQRVLFGTGNAAEHLATPISDTLSAPAPAAAKATARGFFVPLEKEQASCT